MCQYAKQCGRCLSCKGLPAVYRTIKRPNLLTTVGTSTTGRKQEKRALVARLPPSPCVFKHLLLSHVYVCTDHRRQVNIKLCVIRVPLRTPYTHTLSGHGQSSLSHSRQQQATIWWLSCPAAVLLYIFPSRSPLQSRLSSDIKSAATLTPRHTARTLHNQFSNTFASGAG